MTITAGHVLGFCIGIAIKLSMDYAWHLYDERKKMKQPRGKHLLNRETLERKQKRDKFIHKYKGFLSYCHRHELKHNNEYSIDVINYARKEIGFSDSTDSMDIYRSVMNAYKKFLQEEVDRKTQKQ